MFGFFLQTGQTFRLPRSASPLKEYPKMCSSGSKYRPDLIQSVNQVIPQLVKSLNNIVSIPLFVPMKIENSHLKPLNLASEKVKFCLMFYPNPNSPPTNHPLVVEYWESLRPMIICCDMGGYYLGCPEDPHIVFFEQINSPQESSRDLQCSPGREHRVLPPGVHASLDGSIEHGVLHTTTPSLRPAISNYQEDLSYGSPQFGSTQIYLRRHHLH
jgi:hypothetical protein